MQYLTLLSTDSREMVNIQEHQGEGEETPSSSHMGIFAAADSISLFGVFLF